MSIKLIALDLDNTTLNAESRLSAGNRRAIETAIDRGVNVVIATGRCLGALPDDVTAVRGIQYAITSNGAQIRDLRTGDHLYTNYLAPESVASAASVLRGLDPATHMVEVFVDGTAYMEKSIYEDVMAGRNSHRHRDYVLNTRHPQDHLLDFMLENRDSIENINIFFNTMSDKRDTYPLLETIPNVTLTTSLDNNWEIGGATTSKASALHELGRLLDVSREEIMACGDSPNDGAMLREAGVAVAVANAKPVILEMADFISGSNDDDGVATAIEKFVL
ncbi:MAG: HAD-IIB family hydrolase [Anaerovoracaceae bacterium]|jgi:Cof subfamily protein (haloacid dehalogenase superfamily)